MPVLPNVLAKNLDVVFCGTAPGTHSAQAKAYYAFPSNKFWPILYAVGLTPRQFAPSEYRELLKCRLGLTDLAKRVSGADSTLNRKDFGIRALRRLITLYQPQYVAFTSKRAGREFFGSAVEYGIQPVQLGRTRFFVLSSTSGLASGSWQKGKYWYELAALVRPLSPNKPLQRSATKQGLRARVLRRTRPAAE
jgi:double-stranded uracil-DNA glycosylase